MQGEIEKLKDARGGADGTDDFVVVSPSSENGNGDANASIDAEELGRLQAEKEKARADLETAMAELEEKAKLVNELQKAIAALKSEKDEQSQAGTPDVNFEELAKRHAEEMESLKSQSLVKAADFEEKLDKLTSGYAKQIAKLASETEEVMMPVV